MKLIDWQYYPKWHWPWLNKTQNSYAGYAWNEYWFGFAFWQFNVAGKPWIIHLERSPEYIAAQKEWLLNELQTMKHTKVIKDID